MKVFLSMEIDELLSKLLKALMLLSLSFNSNVTYKHLRSEKIKISKRIAKLDTRSSFSFM